MVLIVVPVCEFCHPLLHLLNDQGQRRRQEYTAYAINADGRVSVNPEASSDWLKQPA